MAKTESASLAELLKHYRAAAGQTQEELAERASLSARSISDLERGVAHRPQAYTVQRLVQALGLQGEDASQFELAARRLRSTAPDARSGAALPISLDGDSLSETGNLPIPPTPFIGRQREVREIASLLRREDMRLLTLTGPGGVGKSRLALRVVEEVRDAFPDGVCFVSLASLLDPELVPVTLATALGVKEVSGQLILATLTRHLRPTRLLLVVDNFEHLLPAATVLSDLLVVCPRLQVLVTSRAVLHLAAEHEYRVPPLAVPTPHHLPNLDALSRYDAVQLFVQRAEAVTPDFRLTGENAAAIAEICHRVDGLPLAIELAAARIRLFPPQALLARLQSRLQLLTGGPQDRPARQQTLRGTIDWSYALLTEEQQRLVARLSVFAGGCTLDAIEAICNPERTMDSLAATTALVEQNLLRVEEDEPRFVMLETVREYATERLKAGGEAEVTLRQHAQYFCALADEARVGLAGVGREDVLERLESEHDNLRAALQWALEGGHSPEIGLGLAAGLTEFWQERGYRSEGTRWLKLALAQEGTDASVRADALEGAARLAFFHGDYGWAIELHEEKVALERGLGDTRRLATALQAFGVVAQHHKNLERATLLFEESLALFQDLGDAAGIASARSGLGYVAKDQGDYDRATRLLEESLDDYRELQDVGGMYWTLMSLGLTASAQGNYEHATALIEESAALTGGRRNAPSLHALGGVAAEHGDDERAMVLLQESMDLFREEENIGGIVSSLHLLARVALRRGERNRASSLYAEALTRLQDVDDTQATLQALEGMACTLAATDRAEQAVRLFAATDHVREVERIVPPSPGDVEWRDQYVAGARGLLEAGAWEKAWQAGHAMTLQQAVAYALAGAAS